MHCKCDGFNVHKYKVQGLGFWCLGFRVWGLKFGYNYLALPITKEVRVIWGHALEVWWV
jgi:hypothetical protein